ncbi:MAG: hypothetical protein ACTSWU_00590 [Candidatus Thorarchaeota archaeon]
MSASFFMLLKTIQNEEDEDLNVSENNPSTVFPSRVVSEGTDDGGLWYDDFSDNSMISSSFYLKNDGMGYCLNLDYVESFESYNNGQSIISQNGWTFQTGYSYGTATASTSVLNSPSTTVGFFNNKDNSVNQHVLSGTFDVDHGRADFWVKANYVWGDDHTSTAIGLYNTVSTSPSPASDQSIMVGFKNGGLSYYTNNAYTKFANVNANTWYHIIIDFNCTNDKFSVYVMDASGSSVGSATNVDFRNTATSLKRFNINTGRQSTSPSLDFNSSLDDLFVVDVDDIKNGSIESKVINLPEGQEWSSLRIDKDEPNSTQINIAILDSNRQNIPGLIYDPSNSEIDISSLNSLGIDSIILNATFSPDGYESPVLYGWGVDWNASNLWRDTFLTSLKVSSFTNTKLSIGKVTLREDQTSGWLISEAIFLPSNNYWDFLKIGSVVPSGSTLTIDILDGSTMSPIQGFQDITLSSIDIRAIDPFIHSSIVLRADFFDVDGKPLLDYWMVTWKENTAPRIMNVTIPNEAFRTEEVKIGIEVEDLEQSDENLTIHIFQKSPTSSWIQKDLSSPIFNHSSELWEVVFYLSPDSELGHYSFNISVIDEFSFNSFILKKDILQVNNNVPTDPVIKIDNTIPTTITNISAHIEILSEDVEGEALSYTIKWFVNGEEKIDYRQTNINSPPYIAILPSNETKKGDNISVQLICTDGIDNSSISEDWVLIENSVPLIDPGAISYFQMNEDQAVLNAFNISNFFKDLDDDHLDISYYEVGNLTLSIMENGSVSVIPDLNWYGNETVVFSCNDEIASVHHNITFEVFSVNDPPVLEYISIADEKKTPELMEVVYEENLLFFSEIRSHWVYVINITGEEDEETNISVVATDVDNRELTITLSPVSFLAPLTVSKDPSDYQNFSLQPYENENGNWWLNLTIDDGNVDGLIWIWINYSVEPVNDEPEGSVVIPESQFIEGLTGDNITFKASGMDVDGDNLTFHWFIDGSEVSSGNVLIWNWTHEGLYNVSCTISDGKREIEIGFRLVNISEPIIPEPPFTFDELFREYQDTNNPIKVEIKILSDTEGEVVRWSSVEDPSVDILSLTSTMDGEDLIITMQLSGSPRENNIENMFDTENMDFASYWVYFVKENWSEPKIQVGKWGGPHPNNPQVFMLQNGWTDGLVFDGISSYGDPRIEGNAIIFTISIEDLVEAGIELGSFELYGVATYSEASRSKAVSVIDTVGGGSIVNDRKGGAAPEKEASVLIPIILIVIVIIILITIIFFIFLMKRKKDDSKKIIDDEQPTREDESSDSIEVEIGEVSPVAELSSTQSSNLFNQSEIPLSTPPTDEKSLNGGELQTDSSLIENENIQQQEEATGDETLGENPEPKIDSPSKPLDGPKEDNELEETLIPEPLLRENGG